jgi:tetratricopeptide (TPR) repeat protein
LQLLGAALAAFGIWIAVALAHNAPAAALAAGVVFVLCGGLMALVGRSVIRPRLRAARDMAATAEPGPLEAGLAADLEAHMDGMLPAELRALAARVSTQLEQGFHDAAIALVSGPSDRHPGNLALHMFAADIHGRSGNVDAALRSLRHAQSLQGLGEAARVALCHLEVRLLASAGRTAAAVAAATAGLALPAEKAIRVRFLDMLASLPLLAAHGEFLPQAEGWSAEAMALDPSTTIRATRAGVLYESGRVEEAEPLLREVSEESTDPADLGLSHMYLALLAEARGDRRTARRQAWIAFNHYPDRRLVERLASDGLADS